MPEPDSEVIDLMERSALSFTGVVERVHDATVANVPVDDATVVVRVREVLHAPPALAMLRDAEVTVQLAEGSPLLTVGSEAAFFTDPLVLGSGLALREVGRRFIDEVDESLRMVQAGGGVTAEGGTGGDYARQLADRRIRSHAASADAIVVGTVTSLSSSGPVSTSEHAPDYWIATISVSPAERVSIDTGEVQVLYMNSRDVRWKAAPKPLAGETAMWLLHSTIGSERNLAPWVITHPEDRQPLQSMELLQNEGREP